VRVTGCTYPAKPPLTQSPEPSSRAASRRNSAVPSRTFGGSRTAGARPEQLVKAVSYLRDEADLPHYNDLYRAAFTRPRPARTTTQLGFQFLRFEIEAVAYLGP
jgi:hypothetical protein